MKYDVVINQMGIPLLRRESEIINAFEHENTAVRICAELNRLADRIAEIENDNAIIRNALYCYSECSDGCTCGDGWSHEPAIEALRLTTKEMDEHA